MSVEFQETRYSPTDFEKGDVKAEGDLWCGPFPAMLTFLYDRGPLDYRRL